MVVYFVNPLEYKIKDLYFKACYDNTMYELFCYANTEGKIIRLSA